MEFKKCKGCLSFKYPMQGSHCNPCKDKMEKIIEELRKINR